jgi:hypothetical protein
MKTPLISRDVLPNCNLRRHGRHQIAMEQTKLLLAGSLQGIAALVDARQFGSVWQEL